jgi:REP element-mobilizing transposase RayT
MKKNIKVIKNLEFIKRPMLAYGGDLRKKAKNRGHRPLVFRSGTVHLCLRSTKATGRHSFLNPALRKQVDVYVRSFSARKGVHILSFANVGNHIHLHVKLINSTLYKAWIRGLSSGLAMLSMGLEGFKKLKKEGKKFWDQRPFSRVIQSFQHFLNTKAYVEINKLEAMGMSRKQAELIVSGSKKVIFSTA